MNEGVQSRDRVSSYHVQTGKPSASPDNTAQHKVLANAPSSIPSSARITSDMPPDLVRLVASWERLEPTLRAAIIALAEAALVT